MLVSIILIIVACFCVGGGRIMTRRARRAGNRKRSLLGWTVMLAGLLLMIAGVVHWPSTASN